MAKSNPHESSSDASARERKIATLRARLLQLEEAQKAAAARARASASKRSRAQDTRRKILAGAFVLERLGSVEAASQLALLGGPALIEWLRPADRALFLPASADVAASSAGSPLSGNPAATAAAVEVAR